MLRWCVSGAATPPFLYGILLGAAACIGPAAFAQAPTTSSSSATRADGVGSNRIALSFVGTDPGTSDQAAPFEAALAAAFTRNGTLTPAAFSAEPTPPAAPDAEIAAHVKAAQDAYGGLDLDTAVKEYAEAIRVAFVRPETADPEQVAQLFLAMGNTYQLNGDMPHAQAAYRYALALRPELQPDTNKYGPDIRAAFTAQQQALQALASAQPSELDVDVDGPSSAHVTIDGRAAGTAPVRGFKVWSGRHLVVAQAPGFTTQAAVSAADPGQTGNAHLTLPETPAHQAFSTARTHALAERQRANPGPGVAELAQQLGAQLVAVGALSSSLKGTRVELTLFDVAAHRRVAGVTREVLLDSALLPHDLDGLVTELIQDWRTPGVRQEQPAVARAGRPIYQRWYFWAGVGAAAVAAGAAATFVATQPSSPQLSFGAKNALGIP